MQAELNQLIASKDVIVLTSSDKAATSWLKKQYLSGVGIQVIEDAHQLDTEQILELCHTVLSEGNKMFLTAQFRSQLPIIKIASLCNDKRRSLINIELSGWNNEKAAPDSYSSF
jgi:hypothetical protein